jgi:uncharacterized membrane protein
MRNSDGGRAVERLAFFSDAVFAVVLGLLAIHIAIPPGYVASGALHDSLGDAIRELVGFGISFAMIGVLWVDHHRLFDYLRGRDERLLWANLAFLLCVGFLAYPAGVFTKHTGAPVAVLFFTGTLLITALVSALVWWYVSGSPRLVGDSVDRPTRVQMLRRPLSTAAILVVAAPTVLVGFSIGTVGMTLAPIVWILALIAVRLRLIRGDQTQDPA